MKRKLEASELIFKIISYTLLLMFSLICLYPFLYAISAADNRDVITLNVGDFVTIDHAIPEAGEEPSILDGYTLTIDARFIGQADGPSGTLGFTVDAQQVPAVEPGAEIPFQLQTFPGHIAVVPASP